MKLSTKLFFSALAFGAAFFVAQQVAVRTAFGQKTKVDFGSEMVEKKAIQPFKNLVFEGSDGIFSIVRVKKGDRFALASSEKFWKSSQIEQRGDTLFIRQTAQIIESFDDDDDEKTELVALCPSLASIRADCHVEAVDLVGDSLSIFQATKKGKQLSEIRLRDCRLGGLRIETSGRSIVRIYEKNELKNVSLSLRDSVDCRIDAAVSGQILIDASPKTKVALRGENLSKVVKN